MRYAILLLEMKVGGHKEVSEGTEPRWTYLTNHTHVLICLSQDSELRLRDVADKVGITERAVQRIVAELEEAGAITRFRDGRRNRYDVHLESHLRHSIESHRTIGDIVNLINAPIEA
jgi:DNA-binding transcriptional ArsR family regulator